MEKVNRFKEEKWKRRWDDDSYYWQPADKCLYQLFHQTPITKAVTLSKVGLLGRYYGTQIERKKVSIEDIGNDLYNSKFKDLPNYLKKEGLCYLRFSPETNIYTIHAELTSFVREKTRTWEIVFASKWLHFHCPHLFPIIDSRSEEVLLHHEGIAGKKKDLVKRFENKFPNREGFNKRYFEFCCCLFELRRFIAEHEQMNEAEITPKDLDLYLQTYED